MSARGHFGLLMAAADGGGGGGSSVWNPSDAVTNGAFVWSFSEGNARAAASGTNVSTPRGAVRGEHGRSAGKWYFEIECVTAADSAQNFAPGVCDADVTLVAYWQSQTGSGQVSYHGNGQQFKDGATFVRNATAYGAGAIVGAAVNMDAKSIEFFLNGASKGSTTFTASAMKPYFGPASHAAGSARLKTAAADLTYSPPSGFAAWD